MRIITGATGTAHVTSNDDGEFNQGLYGTGLVVLANGYKLAAQIIDNNTVRIKDGDLLFQGRHALINPGTTEDVTIDTGNIGYKRNDLICAKYEVNQSTSYESITLVVKKGTQTTGTPSDPSYTTGTIRTGSTLAEIPLYRVKIEGATITSVQAMFTAISSSLQELVAALIANLNYSGETFVYDKKNGVRGYNTSANRGSSTFHPFANSQKQDIVSGTTTYTFERDVVGFAVFGEDATTRYVDNCFNGKHIFGWVPKNTASMSDRYIAVETNGIASFSGKTVTIPAYTSGYIIAYFD